MTHSDHEIRTEVHSKDKELTRLLLMIWEEIVEFKHCFIYRNDEPLERMKYHDEGVDEEHTKGHHTG